MAPGVFTLILPFVISSLGLPKAYLMCFIFFASGVFLYYLIAVDSYYFQLLKKGESREKAIKISQEKGLELFPAGDATQSLLKSAQNPKTWLLVLLYFTSFGGFLAFTTWLPTFLSVFYELPIQKAGIIAALGFSMLASLARIIYGFITDRIGGELSNIIAFIVVLIGAIILTFSNVFMFSLIGIIVIALGKGFANAAVFKLVPKYVSEAVGGASGWVSGLGAFGGFAIPPILGIIVDKLGLSGYQYGFSVYIILAIICIFISSFLFSLSKSK